MSRKKSEPYNRKPVIHGPTGVVYDITPILKKKAEERIQKQSSGGQTLSNIAWLVQDELPRFFHRVRFLRRLAERRRAAAQVPLVLMHFKRPITTDDALDEMLVRGYRPATTMEFNAFREKCKYVDIQFPVAVVGIDPEMPGDEFVSSRFENGISTIGHRRRTWETNVRFAVVRVSE